MKPIEKFARRIREGGKGLWGIECPEGTRFDFSVILESPASQCVVEKLSINEGESERHFRSDESTIIDGLQLDGFAKRLKEIAQKQGSDKVRIVVSEFHLANADEQSKILREARCIQESERTTVFQFVICGRWSHYLSKLYHFAELGSSSSPPTDAKNSLQVSYATEESVLDELIHRNFVRPSPTDLDQIGCAYLVEQTAGDWFLIEQALEQVNTSEWTDSIEQSISELESSPEVVNEIIRRLNLVGDPARVELQRLLRAHRLFRSVGSKEVEELWLSGLTRKTVWPGGHLMLEIASPVIEAVIRKYEPSCKSDRTASSDEVCFRRNSIATAAYGRVADIENLLRNVIVEEFRSQNGRDWMVKLAETKTRGNYQEDLEEIIQSLLRKNYSLEPIVAEPTKSEIEINRKHRDVTILDSAKEWQLRQRNNHAVSLHNDNLMHFLTTESLIGVLEGKRNKFYGEDGIFNRENLLNALGEYASIRSAVAHNQPIKLSMILKLDDLLARFVKWLTTHADRIYR